MFFDENNDDSNLDNRKVYFQLLPNRKLRVYETITEDKKRQQNTLATLGHGEEPSSKLLEQLSTEDQERLQDYLNSVREQKTYENVRAVLKALPEALTQAAHLLEVKKLTLNENAKQTLRESLLEFAKRLK